MTLLRTLAVGTCLLALSLPALAQNGISPSQTALWLDELHLRNKPAAPGASEAATPPVAEMLRANDPQFMSMSLAGALRLQGDLTSYSSQFQTGSSFLATGSGSSGAGRLEKQGTCPVSATLDQSFAWNRIEFGGVDQEALTSTTQLSLFSQHGSLESGRLTLDAVGGVTLASTDDFALSSSGGDTAWFMQPGSSLVYEKKFGQVTLTLYDRFAARPDALLSFYRNLQATTLVPFVAALQNDLGAALTWQPLDDLSLTLNYNWASSQSARGSDDTPGFNPHGNLDVLAGRDIHSVLASVAWQASPAMRVGVRTSASWTSYEEDFANDGRQWHSGLFADLRLPFRQTLQVEAGAQAMSFDRPGPLGLFIPFGLPPISPASFVTTHGDSSGLDAAPYCSLSLGGPLGKGFSHRLAAGQEASLALLANYIEARFINYAVQAKLWKGADLGVSGFYESIQDSGGVFAGDTDVYGLSTTLRQTWRRFTFTAGYGYTRFDTDAQPPSLVRLFATARQHAFHTSASYKICQRTTVSLAWQRITSDFATVAEDAVQDRLTMSVRLLF